VCLGFLEKNRDTFSLDLLHVVQSSTFKFFTDLFVEDFSMVCRQMAFVTVTSQSYQKGIDSQFTKNTNVLKCDNG